MSYLGGIVILFILATRVFLKKTPKKYSFLLWSIALIRLVLPISIESSFSLIPVNPNPLTNDSMFSQTLGLNTGTKSLDQIIYNLIPNESVVNSVNPIQVWISIGAFVWVVGMSIFFIHAGSALFKMKRTLKESTHIRNNIYTNSTIKTPFVLGLLEPKIYLPDFVSDAEMRYIVLHEEMHIKRRDHIIKFISYLALCIHWFNPLVWIAYYYSGQDMEMSCDESVIRQLGYGIKKDYAQSLLNYTTGSRSFRMTPLAFGEGDTKGRIKNVLNFRQPKFYIIFITIVVIILISIGLLFNPLNGDLGGKSMNVQEAAEAINKIGAVIENEEEVDDGIVYDILISNNSRYMIYELSLALSYPIKRANGSISNKERIEAELKVESIESGSYEIVKVFVPSTYYLKENLDVEHLEVNLDGYLNEVTDHNKFSLSGPISSREALN